MTTLQLFRQAFLAVPKLNQAKKMPFWKVIFYIIFLSALLALPTTKQVFTILHDIKSDGQKIATKIPDFSITDGSLQTKSTDSGFIYQTNSIIFTFDPDGKRSVEDVQDDVLGNAFGVAFLQDQFVIALPNSGVTEAVFGTNQFTLPYSKGTLDGFTSKELKNALDNATIPWWVKLIVFLVSMYPVLLSLIINLLFTTLGAVLYSRTRFYRLSFLDCLKIVTYCGTVPVILSSILHFFNPTFDDSFLIILASLFFFFNATRSELRYPPGN